VLEQRQASVRCPSGAANRCLPVAIVAGAAVLFAFVACGGSTSNIDDPAAGGASVSGGSSSQGGIAPSGGAAAHGGSSAGGKASSGGVTGGQANGGSATGGDSSGGAVTGGTASGGSASSGSGGKASTGGSASGGKAGSGGNPNGGKASAGGNPNGGKAGGGASAGGSAGTAGSDNACQQASDCAWGEISHEILSKADCVCLFGCPYLPQNRTTVERRRAQYNALCTPGQNGQGMPCPVDDCIDMPDLSCVNSVCARP
jgi:hypothetical protein